MQSRLADCCAQCPQCQEVTCLDLNQWCEHSDDMVCWSCCERVHGVAA